MNTDSTITSITELAERKNEAITRIKIADNLTYFPKEIFNYAKTLEILDLSNNQLSELPSEMSELKALKILFLSNNKFVEFPSVLFQCPVLTMIGFKANQIKEVPENALPINTRWLILTNNAIDKLPNDIGRLNQLQKCMLAGNSLIELPKTISNCDALQLLRISANQLQCLPACVVDLPSLAWLAIAGNPFSSDLSVMDSIPKVLFSDLEIGKLLGEGASGLIYKARLNNKDCAVKLFKGEVTSDGYPEDELQACLCISSHPNLVKVVGQINEPESRGVIMDLIPDNFTNLGLPPSLETCTRDVFDRSHCFDEDQVIHIIHQMIGVLNHIHEHQFIHGDLYAHNVLVNEQGDILFGDMGAASYIGNFNEEAKRRLRYVEYRALAYFIDDVVNHCANFDINVLPTHHVLNNMIGLCQNLNSSESINHNFLNRLEALH